MRIVVGASLLAILLICPLVVASEPKEWSCEAKPDRLVISLDGEPACEYVFADDLIKRPFFCRVHAPGGVQVTRSQPPVKDQDPTDHADMHPGIWLGFGDLNGVDFWRNQGTVEHVRFAKQPAVEGTTLSFTVENHYRRADRRMAVEQCTHALTQCTDGYVISFDSTFSGDEGLDFGDQEEMGLGVRVASPLRVSGGKGQIVDNESRQNERQIWGKSAEWCDYRGEIDRRKVGIAVLVHPQNFRPSWLHVRDYGLLVANPFGRKALTGGESSSVKIPAKEPFRLRFAVLVHGTEDNSGPPDIALTYREYLERSR